MLTKECTQTCTVMPGQQIAMRQMKKISYPALTTGSSSSLQSNEFFYSKNNYMRLKNVVLGYTLPKRWSSKPETGEMSSIQRANC